MAAADLDAIVAIDAKLTGRDRRLYYQAKLREMLEEAGVRVSPIAEADGRPISYIMARVDYGEFGRQGIGAALMSQLVTNLDALHVERLRTTVAWNNFPLLGFLSRSGFAPAQQLVLSLPVA